MHAITQKALPWGSLSLSLPVMVRRKGPRPLTSVGKQTVFREGGPPSIWALACKGLDSQNQHLELGMETNIDSQCQSLNGGIA